tara:strand:- start:112 stop:702 length:591 start_codon:yes stop_codon:yes gene_type:complete
MFTGIIEELGKIKSIKESKDFYEVSITSKFSNEIKIGDSIAINGVCLTATYADEHIFNVNIIRETLNKSSLNNLEEKVLVNLERAMTIQSRLDGHIVQGHVESVGKILCKDYLDKQTDFTIELNEKYLKYCIKKGSIAIDGISLTIADIVDNKIIVAIIPHTLENTTLKFKEIGDIVNIETDMFAKYVENILAIKN